MTPDLVALRELAGALADLKPKATAALCVWCHKPFAGVAPICGEGGWEVRDDS